MQIYYTVELYIAKSAQLSLNINLRNIKINEQQLKDILVGHDASSLQIRQQLHDVHIYR